MSETTFGLMSGFQERSYRQAAHFDRFAMVAIIGQATATAGANPIRSAAFGSALLFCHRCVRTGKLVALIVFPENKRLTEFQNFLMVLLIYCNSVSLI